MQAFAHAKANQQRISPYRDTSLPHDLRPEVLGVHLQSWLHLTKMSVECVVLCPAGNYHCSELF